MKNELIKIGPITIYGYGLMIALGILAAYVLTEYRAKKLKLESEKISYLAIWGVGGGILGAKLLYYITEIKEIVANPKVLLNISDGFVVFGGIIGGILGGYLYCKRSNLKFLKYFDLIMPAVALAQGFGRIGCFLAGCCYGEETTSSIGVVFKQSNFAPNGVKLIPTQLISSGLDFLNFLVLLYIAKNKKVDGQVAGFYLVFYSAGRFVLEFFRGDLVRGTVGIMSTSQFISIFTFIMGMILVLVTGNRHLHEAAQ
ncbi:prolipoprotein diacylglyceryl transferase [Clostridium manihotivorum]|uniref:Phosphatidylglycerol--prolipoprotein diacylglyceryl transferase n=1 Tax=Clostridium manihotivorum TaxID=2320868 RepID=A0A3R5QW50_9CLOT|nr:prolipoprotein diacylglyceryl transferase [Clostridium manihotivorum]QAA33687.1 prolipoprotein diacylglyceryl transferase [Clostridium manihotivorum]